MNIAERDFRLNHPEFSGVGVIVASSPMLFAAIKLLGACFLIWLSLKLPCLKTEYSL
jgi:arginine exporter protein ArgO